MTVCIFFLMACLMTVSEAVGASGSLDSSNLLHGAWKVSGDGVCVLTEKGRGPGGGDALLMKLCGDASPVIPGLVLQAGRRHHFGIWVQTRNFRRKKARLVIHSHQWQRDVRTGDFPVDTGGKWVCIESTDTLPASGNGMYSFRIHGEGMQPGGELRVAFPFIEEAPMERAGKNLLLARISQSRPFGVWTEAVLADGRIRARILRRQGYCGSDAVQIAMNGGDLLKIGNLSLKKGAQYRFGMYVKTEGLKGRRPVAVIYNKGWRGELRSSLVPGDTCGVWVKIHGTGKMPASSNGLYSMAVYFPDGMREGQLLLSDPFLEEAVDNQEKKAARLPAAGGNLLPDFTPGADGEFGLWSRGLLAGGDSVRRLKGQGMDGGDAVRLDFRKADLAMAGLKLIPGEKYRFGAYVRTRGMDARDSRIVIYNMGWFKDISTSQIPENTHGEWVKIEAVGTAPKSRNGVHSYRFYLPNGGEVDVCAPFIQAVSEKGKAGTYPVESALNSFRRLYPVTPLLTRIESVRPKMVFAFSCPLPRALSAYLFRARFILPDGSQTAWKEFPVENQHRIPVDWKEPLSSGAGWLDVELREKDGGQTVLQNRYRVKLLAPLPAFTKKKLNNLVAELKCVPLVNGEISFVNPRRGWIFAGSRNSGDPISVRLDGGLEIIRPADDGRGPRTMRFLERGPHRLEISGVRGRGGEFVIRTVPEINVFPFEAYAKTDKDNYCFDRAFNRKHLWPYVNSMFFYFGWNPKNELEKSYKAELEDRGMRLIGSHGFSAPVWYDKDKMLQDFLNDWSTQSTDGRAVDETSAVADANILRTYSEACWELTEWRKFVHVWLGTVVDTLNYPPVHGPFVSGASHIGDGNGKLLMETYVETMPDLKSLKSYYSLIGRHFAHAKACTPDAPERMMFIFGGYFCNGAWNCNAYPGVDFKYALDYFMHLVATDPNGEGLFGIGCYAKCHCDEENLRWLGRLFRHYAIEGHTEMLSPKYGLVYEGHHVVNPDFRDALKGWQAVPAEEGSIRPRTRNGYGFRILQRRGPDSRNGDTLVELVRSAKGPNRLRQTFQNFKPGKLYSLSFASTDGDAVEKKLKGDRYTFLDASLTGAEILPELCSLHRYPRPDTWNPGVQVVTRKIVFKALQPEIQVEFRDWKNDREPGGPIGARRFLNFINVVGYYAEE